MNRNNKNKTAINLTLLGLAIALLISVLVFVQSTVSKNNSAEQPSDILSITPTNVPAPTSEALPIISPTAIITNAPTPTDETSNNTPTPAVSPTMKVHFIDVDQGDSILVEENGHFMLIDAGVNEKGATVVKYLEKLGVVKLDYVIATHPHNDHIGGLDTVIDAYKVGNVIMPDVSLDFENYEDVLYLLFRSNKRYRFRILYILTLVIFFCNFYALISIRFTSVKSHPLVSTIFSICLSRSFSFFSSFLTSSGRALYWLDFLNSAVTLS